MSVNSSHQPATSATGYLSVLAGRWRIVALTFAACVLVAAVVVSLMPKSYSATAEILVTPISSADEDFVGIPVLRDSTIAPTTSVLTVARLVKTPETEAIASRLSGSRSSPATLAQNISVGPLSQTSIVSITAAGSSSTAAARLANAFARATILRRTADFQRVLQPTVARLERQATELHGGATAARRAALQARLAVLAPLVGGSDPTLQLLNPATPPSSASAPRIAVTLTAAALAGILLGVGFALLREATDGRVRRLEHVLAVLPGAFARRAVVTVRGDGDPVPSAVRALAARLLGYESANARRSIVLVSAGDDEGRTAAAVALARAIGRLRRRALLVTGDTAVVDDTALRSFPDAPKVVVARAAGDVEGLLAARGRGERLDVAVIDSASPRFDPSTLSLAKRADAVVAVVRLGHTRKADLQELGELLVDADVRPAGAIVVAPPTARARTGRLARRLRAAAANASLKVRPEEFDDDAESAAADDAASEDLSRARQPRPLEQSDAAPSILTPSVSTQSSQPRRLR